MQKYNGTKQDNEEAGYCVHELYAQKIKHKKEALFLFISIII